MYTCIHVHVISVCFVLFQAVAENYPAEFGDEQLVQQVVEMLLAATESHSSEQLEHHAPTNQDYMETGNHKLIDLFVHVHVCVYACTM